MTTDEKIQDIKNHPEQHKHRDIQELAACCAEEGALNLAVMEAHQRYAPHGTNGGVRCDVDEGPCSCGGWH